MASTSEKKLEKIEELEVKKESAQTEVELTEVVTQTDIAFKLPDGTIVDDKGMQVFIANKLLRLEKALV